MLVLSVNSRERAERGRELLASGLGDLVGPALVAHQTPERGMEERSGQAPDEPEVPPEEVVQVMHSCLDDHCSVTFAPSVDPFSSHEDASSSSEPSPVARGPTASEEPHSRSACRARTADGR